MACLRMDPPFVGVLGTVCSRVKGHETIYFSSHQCFHLKTLSNPVWMTDSWNEIHMISPIRNPLKHQKYVSCAPGLPMSKVICRIQSISVSMGFIGLGFFALYNWTVVAVKQLKDGMGTVGESQFWTELEMISLVVHRNLLRLIDYCATPNERLLIYPCMSNGSVVSQLRGKPALDQNARKRIAIGTVRGLL